MSDVTVSIPLTTSTLTLIAEAVAEIIASTTTIAENSPWMTRREAADYLRLPVSRLEKDRRIPCHRDRGRVLYHRSELNKHFIDLPNR